MLKFEGFIVVTDKRYDTRDQIEFRIKAKDEATAKKKIRLRYKKRKHLKASAIYLQYVSLV